MSERSNVQTAHTLSYQTPPPVETPTLRQLASTVFAAAYFGFLLLMFVLGCLVVAVAIYVRL